MGLGLELGFEFDVKLPKFPTSNCRRTKVASLTGHDALIGFKIEKCNESFFIQNRNIQSKCNTKSMFLRKCHLSLFSVLFLSKK